MFRFVLFTAMVVAASATAGHCEIKEIPLPELTGEYLIEVTFESTSRSVVFELDPKPTLIRSVSLRIGGLSIVGEAGCFPEMGPGPFPWSYAFGGYLRDPNSDSWFFSSFITALESGPFDLSDPFRPLSSSTWDFLIRGPGRIQLVGTAGFVSMCWGEVPPTATVQEAILVIDADFAVPVHNRTWGSIKSLFED